MKSSWERNELKYTEACEDNVPSLVDGCCVIIINLYEMYSTGEEVYHMLSMM